MSIVLVFVNKSCFSQIIQSNVFLNKPKINNAIPIRNLYYISYKYTEKNYLFGYLLIHAM